jgi:SH3-like domain-containing protein
MDYQTIDPASSKENVVEPKVVKSESPCEGKDLTGKNREVVGDRVNLRIGPGTKFEKVTYVNSNDSDQELVARLESGMRVLEQCVSGDWARVMVDRPARYKESHQGWVAREYLR